MNELWCANEQLRAMSYPKQDGKSSEIESLLVGFDGVKGQKLNELLSGPDFGAVSVDDLLMLSDDEWKRSVVAVLGVLPARRLREQLLADVKTKGPETKLAASLGGTITARDERSSLWGQSVHTP